MNITVRKGDYYHQDQVNVNVEHECLTNVWTTNIANVKKTIDFLNQKKAQIESELALNEEILSGIIEATSGIELLELPEGEV